MSLEAHQQRVIEEKAALDVKIEALHAFKGNPVYQGLPEKERDMLGRQLAAMELYSGILYERLDHWELV